MIAGGAPEADEDPDARAAEHGGGIETAERGPAGGQPHGPTPLAVAVGVICAAATIFFGIFPSRCSTSPRTPGARSRACCRAPV